MELIFLDNIPENLIEFAENEHSTYEKQKGLNCNYTPFYLEAKEDNITLGLVSGYTCYEEVYIDDIVVISKSRKKGVGKALLQAVYNRFSNGIFNNINLVTNEFQAPKFYEKCGFTLEFIRYNKKNPLLTKYFYVKFFDN